MYRVGVDAGGTFTDWVTADPEGALRVVKVPSTPDVAAGVLDALAASGIKGAEILSLAHGTTVGTNALIQRKLPPIALIATRGFRDIVALPAKGAKQDIWDIYDDIPLPSIALRRNRLEVEERVSYAGEVLKGLNEEEARRVVRIIKRRGIRCIAVFFMNSYANFANEKRMKEIALEEHPEAVVCASHEVSPRIMEYERATTTILNTVLIPVVGEYLNRLADRLRKKGYKYDILVAQSGGGLMSAATASILPVRTANSGPAAGALAALFIGKMIGAQNVIGLDMGGTSTDVSVAVEGRLRTMPTWWVEWGHPIMFPSIDVVSIGAGGGSVAWFDEGGKLRNGPLSMGADPGPACYMKGGGEPTNTDAHLVMGNLRSEAFLAGAVKVSKGLSERVIREKIASRLGAGTVEAADAILRVTDANMADAIRLASVRKGLDPRDFALVAFGGCGPLHAITLAQELGIPKVVVPRTPGLTSALGCLLADIRHDLTRSVFCTDAKKADVSRLEAAFQELEKAARERLEEENVPPQRRRLERTLDMCYAGQWRVLQIPLPAPVRETALEECVHHFHQLHRREHAYSIEDRPVEIHGVNVVATGETDKPQFRPVKQGGTAEQAFIGTREVYSGERKGWLPTRVYSRDKLLPEASLGGPAIIEQMDSTILLPPGVKARVDEYLNVIVDMA